MIYLTLQLDKRTKQELWTNTLLLKSKDSIFFLKTYKNYLKNLKFFFISNMNFDFRWIFSLKM